MNDIRKFLERYKNEKLEIYGCEISKHFFARNVKVLTNIGTVKVPAQRSLVLSEQQLFKGIEKAIEQEVMFAAEEYNKNFAKETFERLKTIKQVYWICKEGAKHNKRLEQLFQQFKQLPMKTINNKYVKLQRYI